MFIIFGDNWIYPNSDFLKGSQSSGKSFYYYEILNFINMILSNYFVVEIKSKKARWIEKGFEITIINLVF